MLYLFIKWIHVLAAIIALGTNITYSVWLARVNRAPESLLFTLRTVKLLDDRIANPAYGVSLITGLAMVFIGGLSFTTPWILLSLVLYVLVVLIAFLGYTPTLRRQIELAESAGPESGEYAAMTERGARLGIILGVLVVAIVYLMVMKPLLWG
jgi:uncharacterized membrane protein